MASDVTSKVGVDEKQENYNPKLDFFSEHFDPLVALRAPNLIIPVSNAKTYDNIHKYKSVVEGARTEKKEKTVKAPQAAPFERKWLPHQLPIQTKREYTVRNVFTQMESVEGPLQLLKRCMDKREKIKIWTRHSHDIRGYCTAFLLAFDKHWNLALEDVQEVWTRPKRRKIPALDSARTNSKIKAKVLPPPITIIQSNAKTETCSRHVRQLLIRGEHIAYIVVLGDDTKSS